MEFGRGILKIDPEKESRAVENFIRDTVQNYFRRKGIVIGLSGGIDSAVSAALSVRAVGANRVQGLLLPERDSNPISREYGRLMADSLGIACHEYDITPVLESYGVYAKRDAVVKKMFPDLRAPYKFRLALPQNLLSQDRIAVYHIEVLLDSGEVRRERLAHGDYLELMAANDMKQRTRMTVMYYEAERRYYVVCGTTNRSELIQGFYVKYGDGGVDLEPLAHLYKNQIFQLARYLGVPKQILERTPSPDTYSYEVSDQEFYFSLPYETLDMILYAIEHSVPKETAAKVIGLKPEELERAWKELVRKYEGTRPLRELPPSPKFEL